MYNDDTSNNGSAALVNEETEESKEQNKIFQGQIRSHLDRENYPKGQKGCRKLKEQSGTTGNNEEALCKMDLKFSAPDGDFNLKASDKHIQMTLNKTQTNNRALLIPTSRNISEYSTSEIKYDPNLIHDNRVAYPPHHLNLHQGAPGSQSTKYDDKRPQIHSVRENKSPLQESRNFENNTNMEGKHGVLTFTPALSRKLSEENLECDSLKYDRENSYQISSLSSPTEASTTTSFESSGSFLSKSLNLMDLASKPDQNKLPLGRLHDDRYTPSPVKPKTSNLANEILKSLHVVDDKSELTTDGPSSKMAEYLTNHIVPQLQQQEKEYNKAVNEIAKLQKEVNTYKENNRHLMQRIKQLECERNTQNDSFTSQTNVLDFKKQAEKQPGESPFQTSRIHKAADTQDNVLQKLYHLQELNKELYDANHCWEAQWDLLQRSQASEIERLNQVIQNFKEQDSKRQEEFDKILLTAKRRQNDEEVAKEEALGNLAQMTGNYEGLQAQYDELKRILEERTKEKNDLQTELASVKAGKLKTSEKATKSGNNKVDKKLEKQYQTEIAVLKEQLTVFQEDFYRERNDRARAQSEKDDLISQMDLLKMENARITEQGRLAERNVQAKLDQITALQREISELRHQLRQSNTATQQYQHGLQSPTMQTAQFHKPQISRQHSQMKNQYPKPKAHPETDPYAQPLPPYLLQAHENGLTSFPQNPSQPAQVNRSTHPQELLFGSWNCPFCTYLNHPKRTICEICGTNKGQIPNGIARQGSNLHPRGDTRQYDPNDLCVDSGNWLVSN